MKKLFVLIAAACMTCTAAFAQTVKPFKEGERAVFLGNSITDGGHYHSYKIGRASCRERVSSPV